MNEALQLLALLFVVLAPIWWPFTYRQWKRQQEQRRNRRYWLSITQQRERDIVRSREQKARRIAAQKRAAAVTLPKPKPAPDPGSVRPSAPAGVPPQLNWKLDGMTKDQATSQRLVDAVAIAYPGKSRRWCTEKAISDLERDRH